MTTTSNVQISSDLDKFRIDDIQKMLCKVYWSPGITKNEIQKGIRNSALVVGAYLETGTQIGFLRVISDNVRFAYIMDVIVSEEHRRMGIGQNMVRFAMAHPELRDVYQWLLGTRDAHGVYEKCGFRIERPELWMSVIKPRPDRTEYDG